MKTRALLILALFTFAVCAQETPHYHPLPLGSPAPDFNLPGVDGKQHTLAEYAKAKALVIIFTRNHCPTA